MMPKTRDRDSWPDHSVAEFEDGLRAGMFDPVTYKDKAFADWLALTVDFDPSEAGEE